MNKLKFLIILLVISVTFLSAIWLKPELFPFMAKKDNSKYYDVITIDEITVGILKKGQKPLDLTDLAYIQKIDSVNNFVKTKSVRNPFVLKPVNKNQRKSTKKTRTPRKYRPRIKVNGIIRDSSNPYAILNGEVYVVGDVIKGYTIQSIGDSLVVLHSKKDLYTIKYKKD